MALPYSLTTDKASQIAREVAKDEIAKSGGGTKVIANPAIAGTEDDLTALQVGETKYKITSGGGNHIIDMWVQTDADTGDNFLDTNITYDDISAMLSEGIIPTLHIIVDPELFSGPVASVDGVNVFNNTYAHFNGSYYDIDAESGDPVDMDTYSFSLTWPVDANVDNFSVQRFTISAPEPGVPSVHVAQYPFS